MIITSIAVVNGLATLKWEGGHGPFIVMSAPTPTGPWSPTFSTTDRTATIPATEQQAYYRIKDEAPMTSRIGLIPTLAYSRACKIHANVIWCAHDHFGLVTASATPPHEILGVSNLPFYGNSVLATPEMIYVTGSRSFYEPNGGNRVMYSGLFLLSPDPANPVIVGSYETQEHLIASVAVNGSVAFIGAGRGGVRVLDIADPKNIRQLAMFHTDNAGGIVVRGDYAFIADGTAGLAIWNVANPLQPVRVATHDTPGNAKTVALDNNICVIADVNHFVVFDVANVASPIQKQAVRSTAIDVAVRGNTVLTAASPKGAIYCDLDTYALRVVEPPDIIGAVTLGVAMSNDQDISVNGVGGLKNLQTGVVAAYRIEGKRVISGDANRAFLLMNERNSAGISSARLAAVDLTNPERPDIVHSFGIAGNTIARSGNTIYVSHGRGVTLLLAGPPFSHVNEWVNGAAYGMAVVGHLLYVAVGEAGVAILNVADPANPSLISMLDTPGKAMAVAVDSDSNTLFVADSTSIIIADVSTPSQPSLVTQIGGTAVDVVAGGGFAYCACDFAGLTIVNPTGLLSTLANVGGADGRTLGVAYEPGIVHMANNLAGYQRVDVFDPKGPFTLDAILLPGETAGVAVNPTHVLLANSIGGIMTLPK